jgi:hypothetical protein
MVKCHGLLITMPTCAGREGTGNLEIVSVPTWARRPVMNKSRKLELSKETLRCLDDQDLTGVVGGGGHREGGGGQEQSVALVCISNADNSCVCIQF